MDVHALFYITVENALLLCSSWYCNAAKEHLRDTGKSIESMYIHIIKSLHSEHCIITNSLLGAHLNVASTR